MVLVLGVKRFETVVVVGGEEERSVISEGPRFSLDRSTVMVVVAVEVEVLRVQR